MNSESRKALNNAFLASWIQEKLHTHTLLEMKCGRIWRRNDDPSDF